MATKTPIDIDNFYTQDGSDGCWRNIARTSPYLSWMGGCPYYGYYKGNPMRWGYDNEPTHLQKITDPVLASELADRIEIKDARKKIIAHLDEIKRLGDIIKRLQ